MKQLYYYYRFLTFYACMLSVNEIAKLLVSVLAFQ